MFSNTHPSLIVFGSPATIANQTRHLPPGEHIQRALSGASALLRPDDPRIHIDMTKATSMATILSYKGMELAAKRLPEGMDHPSMSTKSRSVQLAALQTAHEDIASGNGTWTKQADPTYGPYGKLAAAMEGAGLSMYATAQRTNDPFLKAAAMQALTVAAAAHLVGAKEAALRGTNNENPSVIEAAAAQKRDPMVVVSDMVQLGIIPPTDPRTHIKEADLDMNKTKALQRALPIRVTPQGTNTKDTDIPIDRTEQIGIPKAWITIARQAELRAVQLAQNTTDRTVEHTARAQIAAAYIIERMRQHEQRTHSVQNTTPTQTATNHRTTTHKTSVFGRGER